MASELNVDTIAPETETEVTLNQLASNSVNITGGSITGITDLVVADGGTGASTLTDGGVLLGSGTGAITPMAVLADGEIIIGDGVTDPVALAAFSSSTGTLKVANGGTGAASLTDGGILLGSGTDAITAMGVLANGTIVYGDGTTDPITLASGIEMWMPTSGRLTLTTALPVTTADVTAATTVYFTPYKGNVIQLFDGSIWLPFIFSELSQATTDATKSPAAVGVSSNYDVFVWDDAGTLRATRGPAWTSDTARGTGAGTTELEVLEGRYVNKIAITNGPGAQRGLYVGTIRSDASSQINDSITLRMVWNMYNRVLRSMRVKDLADSWTYSTAAYQQANASTTNQLDMVRGLEEDTVSAHVSAAVSTSTASARAVYAGIGLDSTTALATDCVNSLQRSEERRVGDEGRFRGSPL